MSTPLRRWLSPSSAMNKRPKPMSAARVTAIWPAVFMFRFPNIFRRRILAPHGHFLGLREAIVLGWTLIGEKQEQSKNKIEPAADFRQKTPPATAAVRPVATAPQCDSHHSVTRLSVLRVADDIERMSVEGGMRNEFHR